MMEKEKQTWLTAITLSIIIAAAYLFIASRSTLWDRDEPRFARAAVEMLQSGNYLVPTFNGQLWADKPILTYWLMSLSIKLFGVNEFACRFWSALGTAISCLLTFAIGKKILGARQGLWAMIILASSVMILVVGTMATADGITLPLILGAMAVFIWGLSNGFRFYHIVFIGILMGFGMLAKGPIGALPLPVMIISLWFLRINYRDFIKKSLAILVSFFLAAAIFLLWAIPADIASGGQFLSIFIGRHIINRFFRPMEHHGGNFLLFLPYYLPVIIGGFFPWIIFLPAALYSAIKNKLCDKKYEVVLLVWIISIVLLMSLAATKLPHYIIFIWPAMAVLSAGIFTKNELSVQEKKWLARGNWLFVPVGLIAGLVLIAFSFFMFKIRMFFPEIYSLFVPACLCGIILLFMTFLAARYSIKGRIAAVCPTVLAGIILFQLLYMKGVQPVFERLKITPSIAGEINKFAPDAAVATYKFGEPSLNFYIGKNIKELSNQDDAVEWLKQKNTAVLIIPENEYVKIERLCGDLPVMLVSSREGLNFSKGKKIILLALLNHQEKNAK